MKKHPVAALAAVLFVPSFTQAAEPAPTPLDPVVVTATRNETPLSQTLAAVTVIDRADIEQTQAADLAELLRLRAGLDIARTGGAGQPASVFIRGGNSDHTLVLIDGVRVNPATGGAALALIAPEMIERIEIVKGPRSTLYGSDALAGVINIITRAPQGLAVGAMARGGSYGTRELAASHSIGDDNAGIAISVQDTNIDGYPPFHLASQDRGLGLTTVSLRGVADLGVAKLRAQVWRAEGQNEYLNPQVAFLPDFSSVLTGFAPRDHDTLNQTASVALEFNPLADWTSTLQLSHSTDDLDENQNSNHTHSKRPELRFDNVILLGCQRLSLGGNLAQDRADVAGSSNIHDVRTLYAAYAQAELSQGRHHGVLGASYNHYEGFDDEPTVNVEYGFDLLSGTRLVGSFGTGFHAPDAFDRFGFGGVGSLKPERSRSFEVAVQQQIAKQHRVDLRAFSLTVRDLIVSALDPSITDPFSDPFFGFRSQNIEKSRSQGVELSYTGQFGPLEARLEGSIQDPVNCSVRDDGSAADGCSDGARLKRRAERAISGALTWRFSHGYLGLDSFGTNDRRDFESLPPYANDVKVAGYGLINASAGVTLGQGFSLALRGENLLDQDYETVNGYRQAGVSGYATLRYDWTAR